MPQTKLEAPRERPPERRSEEQRKRAQEQYEAKKRAYADLKKRYGEASGGKRGADGGPPESTENEEPPSPDALRDSAHRNYTIPRSRGRRESQSPPPAMTWRKAAPVIALCVLFDALRAFFNFFWLSGPALLGMYCTAEVGDRVGMLWGLTPAACAAAATGVGYVGSPVFTAIGLIMAFAVGLLGWMTVGLIVLLTNSRIFKEGPLWFVGGLALSEIPFLGALPALTATTVKLYNVQIRKEHAALKKYEQEQKAAAARERALRLAEFEQEARPKEIPDELPAAA